MRRQLVAAAAVAVFLSILVSGCSKDSGPKPALTDFLELWTHSKVDKAIVQDSNGTAIPDTEVVTKIKALSGDLVPAQASLAVVGEPAVKNDTATGKVDVTWKVAKGVDWKYQTTVPLKQVDKQWRIVWSPGVIHPQLRDGDTLNARALPAQRGNILDGAGQPIVMSRPVVVVGIQPSLVKDQAALLGTLDAAFKSVNVSVDLSGLPAQIAAAKPESFVTVVTLRREAYDQIRTQIRDLDGTVFQETNLALGPSRTFARALLGSVGDVTKEQMDKTPGTYAIGDQVGQSGLEEEYDAVLRGTSGINVGIGGRKSPSGTDEAEIMLFRSEPKAGVSLKTTLDQKVQNAADAAASRQPTRSALVAIRISDGAILAAANGPDGGGVNLAFTASVAPGSTFKMITALGLLDKGAVTMDSMVDCPKEYTVDGRSFHNAGNFELGSVKFRVDFAKSCNTAFASLAPKLDGDGLHKAAASVGVGTAWNLGTDVFTGSVPANVSKVEAAAAAFGQGKTVVSPLAMAGATAAVARGKWQQPTLFTELPPAPGPTTAPPGPTTANGTALNAASVDALRTMMREVVTSGSATGLNDLPGDPVYAKTGTAEYDDTNPDRTHAWTVGWRGDIAFAVFVENGNKSSDTAVPMADSFLRAL
jgi:cell division protein FtsI/penicillin-binding protein 2